MTIALSLKVGEAITKCHRYRVKNIDLQIDTFSAKSIKAFIVNRTRFKYVYSYRQIVKLFTLYTTDF